MGIEARKTFGKEDRLSRREDIGRVFDNGRSAGDRLLVLYVLANDLGRRRMAVTVSGRHGPAVARNRIKRLCREAYRLIQSELPDGSDYVIKPRVGLELSLPAIQQSLRSLARRLGQSGS